MVTSDTKMGWNCDSDREKRKDNSKIPTAKRLPPQYTKQEVLTFRLETYVNLLKPWGGLLNVIWGALHLLRNTGNSGWDVNGTHVFRAFHWKVPGNNWNFKKVILFSRWKISGEKACSIYEFSQGITGRSRLFMAISVLPSWILVTKALWMELVPNGTPSSLDGPFRGSFRKFLVTGKRP